MSHRDDCLHSEGEWFCARGCLSKRDEREAQLQLDVINLEARLKRSFEVDEQECKHAKDWLAKHDETCKFTNQMLQGAIGGRITYSFTWTSIGLLKNIQCACGASECLNDILGF